MKIDEQLVNEKIRSNFVILIDEDGANLGKISTRTALSKAFERDLDLLQVSFNEVERIPICKIVDFGKMKYKIDKQTKTKAHDHLKEIRINVNIAEHDLNIKKNKINEFINKRYRVRVCVDLKNKNGMLRRNFNKEEAREYIEKIVSQFLDRSNLSDYSFIDNSFSVMLIPK